MVELIVDGHRMTVPPGQQLLAACLAEGIYIPHLCHLEEAPRPAAACRLCFVEIAGVPAPQPACTIRVASALKVRTDTPAVRRLQRMALRLLLSAHHIDCRRCHANRACALQSIARFLKVGLHPKPLMAIARPDEVDRHHPFIDHYPRRCVLCGRCVRTCRNGNDHPQFSFAGRGIDTVVRHYASNLALDKRCSECRRCVAACPVGALQWRREGAGASESVD